MPAGEQVRHHLRAWVTGVVQAWQSEARLQRPQQREVRVAHSTLQPAHAVVGLHGEHNLIDVGRGAVVILVPGQNNGAVAVVPRWGVVDGLHQLL